MNEESMRKDIIDLVLWTSPDKIKIIWCFVSHYLKGEKVGIHADEEYLIEHGKFLQAKKKAKGKAVG